ncbi:zinc ribbon domain-containing protein [Cohnella abietis]|uniref:Zinc-ribbon domain-containing protein n=1 Tax=Cohnella abietis TaxID=2507935 RepID=A0A3T1D075_9BACL|nr:zinc ribbon domain-containing protein [Cohnella abietis]BBI31500.1 hypothetical protein KCTCHS21_08990 [Cohnella abietis]
MQCTQCGQINQSAKFCVKCGANLQAQATSEVASASEAASNHYQPPAQPFTFQQSPIQPTNHQQHTTHQQPARPNQQLEQAKQVSKQYLSYFLEVLKNPIRTGQNSTDGHMINGIITLILFSLILPLIGYIQLRSRVSRYGFGLADHISFGEVVIKNFFILFIIIMLINSVIFLVLKAGTTAVNYREVTARFGTLMIPAVAFFLIALIFSWLSDGSYVLLLSIGLGMLSWFVAVCFVIYSFKKDQTSGLDAFYGVIITYVVTFYLIKQLGDVIFNTLSGSTGSFFNF